MSETIRQVKASQVLVTMAAFVIIVAGMSAAKVILVPFLLAAFISIISAPPVFWLQEKGVPKWLALLVVILGVLLIGMLVASLVGSSIKDFSSSLPEYQAKLKQQTGLIIGWLERLGVDTSEQLLTQILNPGAAMRLTGTLLNSLGNMFTNAFLILMIVIFMLLEASSFPEKLRVILSGPESSMGPFTEFVTNVKQYMAIKTMVSLITGTVVFIMLAAIGVDYPLLWALLAFALNYVPNIGSIIAAVPVVLLAAIQIDLARAGLVAAGYLIINLLMGNMVEPRFMGRGLGLSTLVVFLSLLFWGWVLGPVGMLLSVPLTITVKIALDSKADTRWLAVLLGPETGPRREGENADETVSDGE